MIGRPSAATVLRRERNPRSVSLKQLSILRHPRGVLNCLRKRKRFYSRVAQEISIPTIPTILYLKNERNIAPGLLGYFNLSYLYNSVLKEERSCPWVARRSELFHINLQREVKEGLVPDLSGDLSFTQPHANLKRQESSCFVFKTFKISLADDSTLS